MKRIVFYLLLSFTCLLSTCSFVAAQNINQIRAKCPRVIGGYGSLLVQANGDINAVPCSGRSFLVNGSPVSGGISGTAGRIPYFATGTTLGNSPFSFNGTNLTYFNQADYTSNTFNASFLFDTTGNQLDFAAGGATSGSPNANLSLRSSGFNLIGKTSNLFAGDSFTFYDYAFSSQWAGEIIPSDTVGRVRFGDYVTTPTNFIDLDNANNRFTISATQTRISNQIAIATTSQCVGEAVLDASGTFNIAGSGNTCYASGNYVFVTGIDTSGILTVDALGVITSSDGVADIANTVRYWIIKRY